MQNDTPKKTMNPIVILLGILVLASALSYLIDSGIYQREDGLVVPGSYQMIEKTMSLASVVAFPESTESSTAHPVGFPAMLLAIPEGMERSAGLIFMVLIIGGMFGIITETGAIDAGLERMLGLVKGNIYVLVPTLMIVFSAGSTFLGLASEYLLIIPLMTAMATRLGMSRLVGFAILAIAVKIGYLTSVTNPLPLTVAQPLVGLQIFSGADVRFIFYILFLLVGILFMLIVVRREGAATSQTLEFKSGRLSLRHSLMLALLMVGVGFLVYASNRWHWSHEALTAYYIGLSIALSAVSGLGANGSATAFVGGMNKVLMASILIGVATAVSVVLAEGKVLDTVVYSLTSFIGEGGPVVAAQGMFASQLLLDFLIPSTSGQAAVSMPILGPIGQLSGVSPQTTVLAFLFGNGLTNMITPTSGTLLAYLATAQVGWTQWARFVFPLWIIFGVLAAGLLSLAVVTGF